MHPLLLAWFAFPILAWTLNKIAPNRISAALLLAIVIPLACLPVFYNNYATHAEIADYKLRHEHELRTSDVDGDGVVSASEMNPAYIAVLQSRPPVNCVIPIEFLLLPAAVVWCLASCGSLYTMEYFVG